MGSSIPYLFILCVEDLSSLLRRKEEVGAIHGYRIVRSAPSVSRLFFAADCYLFFRATSRESKVLQEALQTYEVTSR